MARRFATCSFGFLCVLVTSSALAHVRMDFPTARYAEVQGEINADIKEGPCGRTNDSRTTDPSRVTTLQAGETITVEFRETVGHSGWFRIAFLADGQDFPEPPESGMAPMGTPSAPILLDGIPDGQRGMTYTAEITLPDTPCDNCTLQLIQVMTDRNPYESYYVCADLVLEGGGGGVGGAGGTGAGGGGASAGGGSGGNASGGVGGSAVTGGGSGGSGGGGAGGSGIIAAGAGGVLGTAGGTAAGGSPSGGGSGTAGTLATAGTTTAGGSPGTAGSGGAPAPAAGAGPVPPAATADDEGGCSAGGGRHARSGLVLVGLGLIAGFAARRRVRRGTRGE